MTGKHGVACGHLNECPVYGYMCIPLLSHGDVIGLLYLQNNHAEQMKDEYRY
ncbi:MAG: GAF domain-containing protein [Gammaproteobacteria bacterium]|nr:GAF domain-containing protein [Gammaproteobacteria bacterium]